MKCEIVLESFDLSKDDFKDAIKLLKNKSVEGKKLDDYNYIVICIAAHGNN